MSIQSAWVFPGQGSQHVGMLAELADKYPLVTDTFHRASEVVGYDLWQLTQEGPDEKLNNTAHTQPALLAAGVAVWTLWVKHNGPYPQFLAGHSLGEYTALVCANAIEYATAIELVEKRGRYMQEAVPTGVGAMAALIGLSEELVREICIKASTSDQEVSSANYNSHGQIVVAGHLEAVDRAIALAKDKGAKLAKRLPVSVPSHCNLMKPAAEKLAEDLKATNIRRPHIRVIHNVDVCSYSEKSQIIDALIRQLYSPVRWVETIEYMASQDIHRVIESGPGKVLTGLNKRIVNNIATLSLDKPDAFEETINQIGG